MPEKMLLMDFDSLISADTLFIGISRFVDMVTNYTCVLPNSGSTLAILLNSLEI